MGLTELPAGIQHWPLFISAGLLLNLTPGADMALVLRSAAAHGWRGGAAAALGVGTGCWVHIAGAALGVWALLAGSPWAFGLLRWLGAAYLAWLGLSLLRSAASEATATLPSAKPGTAWRKLFVQGFFTNALNPKVALFFLAFVPQFIRADAPRPGLAFVLLGSVFVFNGTAVNLLIAALVAATRRALKDHACLPVWGRWLNRAAGALFVVLGLRLALGTLGP